MYNFKVKQKLKDTLVYGNKQYKSKYQEEITERLELIDLK